MKTTISESNQKKIKVEFFTKEDSALNIETHGVYRFDPWAVWQQHPQAVIIRCICQFTNPINILKASNDRILAALSEVEVYSPVESTYHPLPNLDASFSHLKDQGYFVEFIKLLGKYKMIFVFNTNEEL